MQHFRNRHGCVCHVAEVGIASIEYRRRTKFGNDFVERGLHLVGEARQLKVYGAVLHGILCLLQLLCSHTFHYVVDALAVVGQHHGHGIFAVAVGQSDGCEVVGVGVEQLVFLVHHLHGLYVACVALEALVLSLRLVELFSPCAVEEDGVHDVCHCVGVGVVDDDRNHAIGLLLTPVVYLVGRLRRCEVEAFDACHVVCLYRIGEAFFQTDVLVCRHVVGNLYGCGFVEL